MQKIESETKMLLHRLNQEDLKKKLSHVKPELAKKNS